MNRLLLFVLIASFGLSAYADLGENGYYRVQNAFTKRYAYLLDNTGSYSEGSTTADVAAIELYKDISRKYSDPSSILLIEKAPLSGSYYNIAAQGTSVYGFLGEYIKLYKDKVYDDIQAYFAYASKSGLVKYLGDIRSDMEEEKGYPSVDAKGDDRLWYINPVSADTDEYFGIAPTQTANGKYFYPFFADFPFTAQSDGMKFYIIKDIDARGAVIIDEIEGVIPAATPVIVECSNPLATDNRLNIGLFSETTPIDGNLLKGVYFDNPDRRHYNRTPFDKASMRVLGVKDGKLVFESSDLEFIPRNQAYLQLTDASQYDTPDFVLMTQEEFDEEYNAVEVIPVSAEVDVYSLDGRIVKRGIAKSDVSLLGKGLYIVRCGGVSEKLIVR